MPRCSPPSSPWPMRPFGECSSIQSGGLLSNNLVFGVTMPAVTHAGVVVGYKQGGTLRSNYYVNCAVGGNTSNIGCDGADITDTDITLTGRTLYKDDKWNTICLPFSMTAAQVTAQLAPAPTSS